LKPPSVRTCAARPPLVWARAARGRSQQAGTREPAREELQTGSPLRFAPSPPGTCCPRCQSRRASRAGRRTPSSGSRTPPGVPLHIVSVEAVTRLEAHRRLRTRGASRPRRARLRAQVARAQDVVDLPGHEQRLKLGGQVGGAVRDVQVANAEHQDHHAPAGPPPRRGRCCAAVWLYSGA